MSKNTEYFVIGGEILPFLQTIFQHGQIMTKTDSLYEEYTGKIFAMTPSFQKVGAAAYKPGLQAMDDFAQMLGNPHNGLKIIHIAGTNGKGSVAHFMATALAFANPGVPVGLYTSPHLADFRERIKIVTSGKGEDGKHFAEISKAEVVEFLSRYGNYIEERRPSFFEITTAMALDFFKRKNAGFVVLETGLGGRLDSTNIVEPILSIITSVGLDHKDLLGDTIERIAVEKGGIIKQNVPVIIGSLPVEAENVIRDIAAKNSAPLVRGKDICSDDELEKVLAENPDLKSDSVQINLKTVYAALRQIGLESPFSDPGICRALANTACISGLRGRWEKLLDEPQMICDIGHNVEALTVSMRQLRRESAGKRLIMVYGMAADKDIAAVKELLPRDAEYIFTKAAGSRAMPAAELRSVLGMEGGILTDTVKEAMDIALKTAGREDFIYVGGSCFVVAEAIVFLEDAARL